jgi:hypothetical protein
MCYSEFEQQLSLQLLRKNTAVRKWLSYRQLVNHYFGDEELAEKVFFQQKGSIDWRALQNQNTLSHI